VNDYSEPKVIVLFDGICHLCQGAVKFIIKRDPDGIFHYASLQSEIGRKLMERSGLSEIPSGTMVLLENDNYYIRSTAALRIAKLLRFPWALMYGFIVIPRFVRDGIYNVVAANRYRWFGRDEVCYIPKKEWSGRFLSDD
jgi:predicted DCC family thiol-disulfide oxidoreductase YuxK